MKWKDGEDLFGVGLGVKIRSSVLDTLIEYKMLIRHPGGDSNQGIRDVVWCFREAQT